MFLPITSGTASIWVCGNADARVAVYTGYAVYALDRIGQAAGSGDCVNPSKITFGVSAFSAYYIQVDGLNGATGNFRLHWSLS
jgi:hypothetical protein